MRNTLTQKYLGRAPYLLIELVPDFSDLDEDGMPGFTFKAETGGGFGPINSFDDLVELLDDLRLLAESGLSL